jgi:hypothetical protein
MGNMNNSYIFLSEDIKERDYFEDIGVGGKVIL